MSESELVTVDLGCGLHKLEGAIGIDNDPTVDPDIICDVLNGIPMDDDSVDCLLASHFMEHVPQSKVNFVLSEIWRICRDGATVVFVVPFIGHESAHVPWHYSGWSLFGFGITDPGHGPFPGWFEITDVEIEYDEDGLATAKMYFPEIPNNDLAKLFWGVAKQLRVNCTPKGKGELDNNSENRARHWSWYSELERQSSEDDTEH